MATRRRGRPSKKQKDEVFSDDQVTQILPDDLKTSTEAFEQVANEVLQTVDITNIVKPERFDAIKKWYNSLFPQNPSKAWCEKFFLTYSVIWISWFLGILVPFKLYEGIGNLGYAIVSLAAALPCVIYPLFFGSKFDKGVPIYQRYWFKANLWILIFGYIGNYFWTHYFYTLLDARYDLDIVRHNNVNKALKAQKRALKILAVTLTIFILSNFLAFMETFSISAYPYYTFKDRDRMYKIGTLFYAIYFYWSFPMFFEMDEGSKRYSIYNVIKSSLAAGMGVTITLDWWRLFIGGINSSDKGFSKIPWIN